MNINRTLSQILMIVTLTSNSPALAYDGIPRDLRSPSKSQIEDFDSGLGAVSPNDVRPLFPLAPNLIKHFEGWEPAPYDDPSGYCTIGFGHLIKKSKCANIDLRKYSIPLTQNEGNALLESDTRTARTAVQHLVRTELKNHEFGALSAFVYNIGKSNFANSTLLKLVNGGHINAASKEFRKWVVSKRKVLPGLVARRGCEAALFQNLLKPDAAGDFVRADCDQLGVAPEAGTLIDIDTGEIVQDEEVK